MTKTPAKLVSLIVKNVYSEFGADTEQEPYSNETGSASIIMIKSICALLISELTEAKRKDVLTVLHLTERTHDKYLNEIMYRIERNNITRALVSQIRHRVISKASLEEKYSEFLIK